MTPTELNRTPGAGFSTLGPSTPDELVDEASRESFPCSDPPSFVPLRVGMPHGRGAGPEPEPVQAAARGGPRS